MGHKRIGIIAGWGRYPIQVAHSLKQAGYAVYGLGIRGHAQTTVARYCESFATAGLTKMGEHIRYFRQHKVRQVTLAGKIHKILLFQPGFLRNNLPDWRCLQTFFPHFVSRKKNRNDDALLTAAVNGYTKQGLEIVAATELIPELLVNCGQLSGRRISASQQQDIRFAWQIAKQMGQLDIGQSVAVKGRAILAVEAVEGTDACIRRAGLLCPAGGFTLVKVAKPNQDMRFDVPTIGVGTIQSLMQAGGSVLAIEADRTIIVDQPQVVQFANRHGISVLALTDDSLSQPIQRAA